MLDLFQTESGPGLPPIGFIDSFAGGGGASTGIELATGKSPEIAINHCPLALAMHAANHPDTLHLPSDVWALDIRSYTQGRPVNDLWASPDCTHFSRARGGKPTSKRVRGLAWVIVEFCQKLGRSRPKRIFMENVEEFLTWEDFDFWKSALEKLGYKLEWKVLRACDYGTPTIRKRLFIVMRRDGKKIRWPAPSHGAPDSADVIAGKLKPWRTAGNDVIDWSQPCHSIFLSKEEGRKLGIKRPLAENTLKRIAAGIQRYVIDAKAPFILTLTHGGRHEPINRPISTVTGAHRGEKALVVPHLMTMRNSGKPHTAAYEPMHTVVADGAQHNLGVIGRPADQPVATITTRGTQTQLVCSHLMSMHGSTRRMSSLYRPVSTITAGGGHAAEVRAFLIKYYGAGVGQSANEPLHTITTNDRFGLVTVEIGGEPYVIADIGMRMLTPRELYRAQGFPDDYKIDVDHNGKRLSKTTQIEKCGNSVCPPVAEALVRANRGEIPVQGECAA
ncbi:DNA (cytosine-5)-methyltransferase 1 [Cohaesibacter sp. ES.047]|uniref:DNA cytosine methyltransferase n=1 Tax=Cohaesibacter sp. ES.047 TaxID=1798205 RepID=UPI000BB8E3AC|nr:DNA cytosine methyltransferase [Cohaesibacter sp. ES.047]SNY94092.1 DNA (cytosine-5)-methyltransferase 1 [Cohaesibacter sp. ES.047]